MQEANRLAVRLEPWCASMLKRREHLTWSRRCSKGDGQLKAAIRYCAVIRRGSRRCAWTTDKVIEILPLAGLG